MPLPFAIGVKDTALSFKSIEAAIIWLFVTCLESSNQVLATRETLFGNLGLGLAVKWRYVIEYALLGLGLRQPRAGGGAAPPGWGGCAFVLFAPIWGLAHLPKLAGAAPGAAAPRGAAGPARG